MRLTATVKGLCVILLVLASVSARAISINDIQFSQINQRDGLSDSFVTDITEDKYGFIWIATANGLNRYDGYTSKQYHPSDVDQTSLPSGLIRDLVIDRDGTLWVATLGGIAKYQPTTDDFVVYNTQNSALKTNNISISLSHDGLPLISDGSHLYLFNNGEISQIFNDVILPRDIKTVRDEVDKIWLGTTSSGLYILSKELNEAYSLKRQNPFNVVVPQTKISDISTFDGEYWIATENGIQIVNLLKQKSKPIQSDITNMGDEEVLSILPRRDTVWLGTAEGFIIYYAKNGSFNYIRADSSNITKFPGGDVVRMFEDKSGSIWLSTFSGAFKYSHEQKYVSLVPTNIISDSNGGTIWDLSEDSQGYIWFVTQHDGIGRFDVESYQVDYFDTEQGLSLWDMVIDMYDRIWVASSEGILLYEYTANNQLVLSETFLNNRFISSFFYDGGNVWVNTEDNNLVSLDTRSKNHVEVNNYSLPQQFNGTNPVFRDDDNNIWMSSEEGLIVYNLVSNKVKTVINSKNGLKSRAISVYADDNVFWIVTRSEGLVKLDANTFQVIDSQRGGYEGGTIFSSVMVGNEIWFANNNGLHAVNKQSLSVNFRILPQQLQFNALNEASAFKSSSNELYFGGNEGFNKITAVDLIRQLTAEKRPSRRVELIEFTIFGSNDSTSQSNNYRTNSTPIFMLDTVNLNYDETRFSINVGVLNSDAATSIKYRYRIDGYSEAWFDLENTRVIQVNNIPFGTHTLEVQAQEPFKAWSESRVLSIIIQRPPWLHNAALTFYVLVVASIIAFIARHFYLRRQHQLAIRVSEERLKLTLWGSGDELWDWDINKGNLHRTNNWAIMDFPQDGIRIDSDLKSNIHPSDAVRVKESLTQHIEGASDYYEEAYRVRTFDGSWVWVLDRGKVVYGERDRRPSRMTGTLKNIQYLKEAEEQLRLFKRSIENISEGVFITDANFKFVSVNNAYCKYTGETREQALASYLHFHKYPVSFTQEIKKSLLTRGNWNGEIESVRVNTESYEMEINIDAIYDEDRKISHFVGVFSDITARKNTEKELLKLANTDTLTGLPNRSFFLANHTNLVRKGSPHTLFYLDMDNFKKVNDSMGHQTGDTLIKQISKRLQAIAGSTATCFRMGGDEFAILIESIDDIHAVTRYAQDVLDALSAPFMINKSELVFTASLGISFYPDDGNAPQQLLKNADTAMYCAKNTGGNNYQFFSGEMNRTAVRQLELENLIRQGIKENLFEVYYQPKVDIASGRLVSMEALVRFNHPVEGNISPAQFIPLSEQTGQIIDIGEIVLRKACEDTQRWVKMGLFSGRVAINISAKQFELPNLDQIILDILRVTQLSPLHVECEITEGTLMENPKQGLRMMERLREQGIHLALDDFGTGYSSLAYLKQFPLNTLKIDKAFIDDIATSSVDKHMAAAIISIAHNLGLKVVAEGVEEERQLAILRDYDCEIMQGYLYSKPLSAQQFERLLINNDQLQQVITRNKSYS